MSRTNKLSANVAYHIWPEKLTATEIFAIGETLYVADEHISGKRDALYLANKTYRDRDLSKGKNHVCRGRTNCQRMWRIISGQKILLQRRSLRWEKSCTSLTNIFPASVMHYIWPTKLTVTEIFAMGKTLYVADEQIVSECDAPYLARKTYHDGDPKLREKPCMSRTNKLSANMTYHIWPEKLTATKIFAMGKKSLASQTNTFSANAIHPIWISELTLTGVFTKG